MANALDADPIGRQRVSLTFHEFHGNGAQSRPSQGIDAPHLFR
jgi:hypothetical protein